MARQVDNSPENLPLVQKEEATSATTTSADSSLKQLSISKPSEDSSPEHHPPAHKEEGTSAKTTSADSSLKQSSVSKQSETPNDSKTDEAEARPCAHAEDESVPFDFIVDQCMVWQNTIEQLYHACKFEAKKNDFCASLSSMVVIILNVLIVGHQELGIFIVCNSVIKAMQVKFSFAGTAKTSHNAKVNLRRILVRVTDVMTEGKVPGRVTPQVMKVLKREVHEAIDKVPGFICMKKLPEATKKRKVEKGVNSERKVDQQSYQKLHDLGTSPGGQTLQEAAHHRIISISPEPSPEASPPVRKHAHHQTPLETPSSLPESLPGPSRPPSTAPACAGRGAQARPQSDPTPARGLAVAAALANEAATTSIARGSARPPRPRRTSTGIRAARASGRPRQSPTPPEPSSEPAPMQEHAHHQTPRETPHPSHVPASDLVDGQRKVLSGLSESLRLSVDSARCFVRMTRAFGISFTTVELSLNALIMFAQSFVFDDVPSIGKTIVSTAAAAASILKGLEMKLGLEEMENSMETAYNELKALQQKVLMAKVHVDSKNEPMEQAELDAVKEAFEKVVASHANWVSAKHSK